MKNFIGFIFKSLFALNEVKQFFCNNFIKISTITSILLSIFTAPSFAINMYEEKGALPSKAPRILYDGDLGLYKEAFDLQKMGRFKQAQQRIDKLDNKILEGYFLYHKYMSPDYNSKYSELKSWLNKYSDLPVANKIYELAKRKAGKGADTSALKQNKKPKRSNFYIPEDASGYDRVIRTNYRNKVGKRLVKDYNWAMSHGYTKNAKRTLSEKGAKKYLTKGDYYRMRSNLAYKYFIDYKYEDAIKWAKPSAEKYDEQLAHWTLGLSYYHNKKYDLAKKHFLKLVDKKNVSLHRISAASYWAYKCLEKKKVNISDNVSKIESEKEKYLKFSATYPKTFYGVLARYQLGIPLNENWEREEFSFKNAKQIMSWQAGIRSIALMQLGFKNEAMAELRWLVFNNEEKNEELIRSVMIFADLTGMQNLALGIAPYFKDKKGELIYTSYLYPEITLEDDNAWKVDKALVHSFIHQESRFKSKASSYVGAIGLMQLMPATASWLEKDRKLKTKNGMKKLENPSYNLYVGQKYINYLLNTKQVKNDLIKLIISYNAGPGNADRWSKRFINESGNKDTLFFIESIRARETRIHVKRVLTNFWHYREKHSQEIQSIEELINGDWPTYRNMDLKQNFPG